MHVGARPDEINPIEIIEDVLASRNNLRQPIFANEAPRDTERRRISRGHVLANSVESSLSRRWCLLEQFEIASYRNPLEPSTELYKGRARIAESVDLFYSGTVY